MGWVIFNLIVVLIISGINAGCARRDNGFVFLGTLWVTFWLSVWCWFVYAIVHFVTKYW